MAITIDWGEKIINVPRTDLTLIQSSPTEIRELNLNDFRMALKALEESEDGMMFLDTHRHNTEVTVAGVTLARVIEIINDYTITFEDGQYAVNLVGANSNVADVVNVNQVSVRSSNSAGLTSAPTIDFLADVVRNKKLLTKISNTWYLSVRNSTDTDDIMLKALKDKDGNDITDLQAGTLAQELASSV